MSSSHTIGTPFIELLSVESTNNYAMGLVRAAMAQHGTTVFAHEQIKGKGQRSRQWLSDPGKNITLSLVLEPSALLKSGLFMLSMTMAAGALQFIKKYLPEGCTIKWPNDLYWNDRKAGGILIENVWQGTDWKFAVAGIGININQTDFGMVGKKAVSFKQVTGKEYEPVALAMELCASLQQVYEQAKQEPEIIFEMYRQNLYGRDQRVKLKKENRIFEATVKDVTLNGQLVVQHATEENFNVGEIEWIINNS